MRKGKTALVLGGGGSRGAYEIGVWQALNELGIEINIVTGTSIGAVNGALVAQNDFETAKKNWKELEEGSIIELTEKDQLRKILKKNLREEAIRSSLTEYGIVTVEFPSFKSHCMFIEEIPKGELIDYILASSACFPMIDPYEINDKKFIDGAYFDNVPVEMALKKGAQNIIAVDLDSIGVVRKEAFKEVEFLKIISCKWSLGSCTAFQPKNTKRLIRLGYLDTMKGFNVFSGEKYTFVKGEFTKRGIAEADAAAAIFELDPAIIYSKEMLDQKLLEAFEEEKRKTWMEELKSKLKKVVTSKPATLLEEEILAKRYIEKNGLMW
nr:patatin-like phospholipase family protein [uncultured Aminipila sp.]